MAWHRLAKGFLLLLATLPLLTGCGPERDDAALVVLTPGGHVRRAVETIVAGFRKDHPEVRVQIVSTPGQDYYVKSLTMLAGRAPVDVLWMGQGFGMFASRGALLDLTPFLEEEATPLEIHSEVLGWYRYRDQLFGIPYGVDTLVIAYNRDLIRAAGLQPPSSEWGLEQMIAMAQKLQQVDAASGRVLVAGLGMEDIDYRYYGLELLAPDQRTFGLRQALGREWLELNLQLMGKSRVLQRGADMESIDRLTGFLNGRVAMLPVATWDLTELASRAHFDWDLAPVPLGHDGKRRAWASSSGFSIARHSKNPSMAWELLKRLSNADFQRQMISSTYPTSPIAAPFFTTEHPAAQRNLSAFTVTVETPGALRPAPRITAAQEIESEWKYWKEKVYLQEISPEDGLEEAERHINRILELHQQEVRQ